MRAIDFGLLLLVASAIGVTPTARGAHVRDLGFHSADGNIGCWIQRDASLNAYRSPPELSVRCVPKARGWTPHWRDCRDIGRIEYFYVTPTVGRGIHQYGCTGGVPWDLEPTGTRGPWDARSLRAGQRISSGTFTCRALSASKIACTNRSGHGFSVSRKSFRLF
jgi:hypothetical protein